MKIKLRQTFFVIPTMVLQRSSSEKAQLKKLGCVSYFDNKVKPADDFFRFVNGDLV
jgi:endothelin-converting enzyme/putative endopeptidase